MTTNHDRLEFGASLCKHTLITLNAVFTVLRETVRTVQIIVHAVMCDSCVLLWIEYSENGDF